MNELVNDIINSYQSSDIIGLLKEYSNYEDISFIRVPRLEIINAFEIKITKLPIDLRNMYEFTNGFVSPNLEVLPILDKENIKKTWNSLENMQQSETKGFAFQHNNINDFLVIGRLSPPNYAIAYNKKSRKWCFETENEVISTELNLRNFIAICLHADRFLKEIWNYI